MPSIYSIQSTEVSGTRTVVSRREDTKSFNTLCATCDISCNVVTEVKKGRVLRVRSSDNPVFRDNIWTLSG